jgi:hypothetical protein
VNFILMPLEASGLVVGTAQMGLNEGQVSNENISIEI